VRIRMRFAWKCFRKDAEASRDTYDDVLKKLKIAGVLAGLNATNLTIVDPAAIPATPVEPRAALMIAFACSAVCLLASAHPLRQSRWMRRFVHPRTWRACAECSRWELSPVLRPPGWDVCRRASSTFPSGQSPSSQAAEAYRCLRTALLLADPASVPKVIAFTSALPKEGKTTTSINMAILMAQKGSRVLLVDADLRRPSVHQETGTEVQRRSFRALLGAEPRT